MVGLYEKIISYCKVYSKNTFLIVTGNTSISYSDFGKCLVQIHNGLSKEFESEFPGNYSVIAPNCISYLLYFAAFQKIGGAAVNLNPNLTNREIEERLNLGKVKVLVTTRSIFRNLEPTLVKTGICKVFIIDEEGRLNSKINVLSFSPLINFNEKRSKDLAFLQFTGGTTGVTKAAMISNKNILANLKQLEDHIGQYIDRNEVKVLIAFPFYHIFSIVFNLLFFMSQGGMCILYKDLRDTKHIIKLFKIHQPNFTVGVNTWYSKLMQDPLFKTLDFSGIRASLAGGEYVPLSTKRTWKSLTGKDLYSAYGLTETSSLAIASPLNEAKNIQDSIGVPILNTKVALLSDSDEWIDVNNLPGEILLKGPQLISSYYENENETKKAFFKGWFRTGDVAVRKQDDFYKIVDRKKDMISVSGNKVYPNEVEEVIIEVMGVLDVAVVGQKSDRSGEHVVACVVARNKVEFTKKKIIEHCKEHLSAFKVPQEIYWYDVLPKTPIGKTARNVLRKEVNL